MKYCPNCKTSKEYNQFGSNRSRRDLLHNECKDCTNLRARERKKNNPEKRSEIVKKYNNSEKAKATREKYNIILSEDDKNKRRLSRSEYRKNIMNTNINFRLAANLRTRLCNSLKNNWKNGSAVTDLGCTIPELMIHLESQFSSRMTWENWGRKGWHIDHIKPLSTFDLRVREELLVAVHYTNLQPLWWYENISKGDSII